MKYFRYLPKLEYSGSTMTNIIARATILDAVRRNVLVLYPYVVPEGERPDVLAHKYYGTSDHTWMIFYANDMVDPIFDWPFSVNELNSYLEEKYGSVREATQLVGQYLNKNGFVIDKDTYLALPEVDRFIKSRYDLEIELNDRKRNIVLIDNDYTSQMLDELKSVFR